MVNSSRQKRTEEWECCPPLQRVYSKIHWLEDKPRVEVNETHENINNLPTYTATESANSPVLVSKNKSVSPVYKILLLGFDSELISTIDTALSEVSKCSMELYAMPYTEAAMSLCSSPSELDSYNVVLVSPTLEAPKYIGKIRKSCMSSVVFVVINPAKNSKEDTKVTSLCIKTGASCVATLPLSLHSVGLIKDWAQKTSRKHQEENQKMSTTASSSRECQKEQPKKRVDFSELRRKRTDSRAHLPSRINIELSALKSVFGKNGNGNRLTESEMTNIATLIGIPASASTALFVSVLNSLENLDEYTAHGIQGGLDSPVSPVISISYDDFQIYYDNHLKDASPDGRFHYILRTANNRFVGFDVLEHLMQIFIHRKGGLLSSLKCGFSTQELTHACALILTHGFGKDSEGSMFTCTDFKKLKICSSMLAAESGIYEGIFAPLRPDKFENVAKAFLRAGDFTDSTGATPRRLSEDRMRAYCTANRFLTRGALTPLFTNKPHGLSLGDFARVLMSLSEPAARESATFFFSILDTNMDGKVCAMDLAFHFAEKQKSLKEQGFQCVSFMHVYRLVADMFASNLGGLECTKSQLLRVNSKARAEFIKGLLFIDDNMTMVDIRQNAGEVESSV